MSNSRVIQNERGTWLAHWCGDPTANPPIEEREWVCMKCYGLFHEFLSQRIDWDKVEQQIGKEETEKLKHLFFITNRMPKIRERVQEIKELDLMVDITCKLCGVDLSHAPEALVEVY